MILVTSPSSLSEDWWTSVCTLRARLLGLALGRLCLWLGRRVTCLLIAKCFFPHARKTLPWSSNHIAGLNAVLFPRFFCEATGVQSMPSGAEFYHRSIACRTVAHLWDPIASLCLSCVKFHKGTLLVKDLSPGVAKLLKMCLSLLTWVIPTSSSTRATSSAVTQGNTSHSEQNTDMCCTKSCFVSPSLSATQASALMHL